MVLIPKAMPRGSKVGTVVNCGSWVTGLMQRLAKVAKPSPTSERMSSPTCKSSKISPKRKAKLVVVMTARFQISS